MKVDLLIIGAGRSGTTTISKYLENHPEVCFSNIKEVHYFSVEELYKRGEKYYHSFLEHLNNEKVVVSADTYLLMDYDAIARIKAYNPEMKILVMLRNPVDRAYSSYNYSVNYGYHEALSAFSDCIDFEKNIEKQSDIVMRNNLGHLYGSLYYKHLSKWFESFPREQFLLLTLSELKENAEKTHKQISSFLGIADIDESFKIGEKHNAYAVPKNKGLEQFLLNRNNGLRVLIRNMIPSFIKRAIIKSGMVDKLHDMNRVDSEYEKLSEKEYSKVLTYFKDDLEMLKLKMDIDLIK